MPKPIEKEVFESFDEFIGYVFEEKQASDNNPLDDYVKFQLPNGKKVHKWTVIKTSGKWTVVPS